MISLFLNLPLKYSFGFNIDLYYFSGYVGYVILGYFLSTINLVESKFFRTKLIILFIVGFFINFYETYHFSVNSNMFDGSFYEYLTPNVLLTSISVFLFCKSYNLKNHLIKKLFFLIDNYSYGIYLTHILILIVLRKLDFYWNTFNPIF